MPCRPLGITALLLAVPLAYDALRFAGVIYLLWLAWQTVRPGGGVRRKVDVNGSRRNLAPDNPRKLFAMGFITSLLNPKIAVLYLSLLPQFIAPDHGSVLMQSLLLSAMQVAISMSVNTVFIMVAGSIAAFLAGRPAWLLIQRWLMGTVLTGLAVRMATEAQR